MALTYRMHDLGLLTNWQYRSTCAELSARGYRTDEPQGLKERETSQILTKVFQGLWGKGIRPGDVAGQLGVTADEMGKMLFGLTIATPKDGREGFGDHQSKGTLSLDSVNAVSTTWEYIEKAAPALSRPIRRRARQEIAERVARRSMAQVAPANPPGASN
ncbi:hypothetical protein [Streptomyces sp. NPDC002491]